MLTEDSINKIMKKAKNSLIKVMGKNITLREIKFFVGNLMEEPEKDQKFMVSLYDCAIRDLDAAKKLYNCEGISPLAIYHLQQSVEKLTKFYGLYSGSIKKSDLYSSEIPGSIGHQSPKMFILMLKEKNLQKKVRIFLKINNQEQDIGSIIKKMDKLIKKDYQIAKISKSQIKKIINFFEGIHKITRARRNELKNKLQRFKNSLLAAIKEDISKEDYVESERVLSKIDKIGAGITDIPINFLYLWYLSILTYPHFNWTRYPHEKRRQLNPEDYKKGLGVVDFFDEMTRIIERRLINRFKSEVAFLRIEKPKQ